MYISARLWVHYTEQKTPKAPNPWSHSDDLQEHKKWFHSGQTVEARTPSCRARGSSPHNSAGAGVCSPNALHQHQRPQSPDLLPAFMKEKKKSIPDSYWFENKIKASPSKGKSWRMARGSEASKRIIYKIRARKQSFWLFWIFITENYRWTETKNPRMDQQRRRVTANWKD